MRRKCVYCSVRATGDGGPVQSPCSLRKGCRRLIRLRGFGNDQKDDSRQPKRRPMGSEVQPRIACSQGDSHSGRGDSVWTHHGDQSESRVDRAQARWAYSVQRQLRIRPVSTARSGALGAGASSNIAYRRGRTVSEHEADRCHHPRSNPCTTASRRVSG